MFLKRFFIFLFIASLYLPALSGQEKDYSLFFSKNRALTHANISDRLFIHKIICVFQQSLFTGMMKRRNGNLFP